MPDKSTRIPRICAACATPFEGYYTAKFCSDECRTLVRKQKTIEYRAISAERNPNRHRDYYWANRERILAAYDPEKGKARHRETYVPRPAKTYVCTTCGAVVERLYGGRHQSAAVHCSRQCRNHSEARIAYRRAAASKRRGAVKVEIISPEDVYERDGYRCAICSRHLDVQLRWPDPKSPSLDHIVPLSLGGAHVLANVRAAHLGCNNRRGNREPAQLRLTV